MGNIRPYDKGNNGMDYPLGEHQVIAEVCNHTKLTLMTKALMKAAGSLILYVLVTRQPPTTVAALLANVNCNQ